MTQRLTISQILEKKKRAERIVMLTAYDYPLAALLDRCAVDIILVGDSLANVVLGLESTREVDIEIMLHHSKAANRAVKNALLVGDMPYGSYQKSIKSAVANAQRFVEEAGCNAVKIEWFDASLLSSGKDEGPHQEIRRLKDCLEVVSGIVEAGIPVMGHVGLTPQSVTDSKGFKVQGRDADAAKKIIEQAVAMEERGCFSLVLECIPAQIAEIVTKKLRIPTLGIGAGPACDGQVLVTHDLLGLFDRYRPKFVKQYGHADVTIMESVQRFREEVITGLFPDAAHSYTISDEELKKLDIISEEAN
jgi:3-methyl-2-oxobutanoate hydroxymethyltransferase